MANGIGRNRIMGISKENTFGTEPASADYALALLDTPRFSHIQNKIENTSAHGTNYEISNMTNTVREATVNLNVKLDENSFPLFLLQNFTIDTNDVVGDTDAKEHVATHGTTSNVTYALFLDDLKRQSKVMLGVKFQSINIFYTQEYIRAELTARGFYPADTSVSVTDAQPNEFVGRHLVHELDTQGNSTAVKVQTATLNHTFNTSESSFNHSLGDEDYSAHINTSERYSANITLRHDDFTYESYYNNNTEMTQKLTLTDTGRVISGATSTNPLIEVLYNNAFINTWQDEGGLNDPLLESFEIIPVEKIGVSDSPAKFTIRNNVASY